MKKSGNPGRPGMNPLIEKINQVFACILSLVLYVGSLLSSVTVAIEYKFVT